MDVPLNVASPSSHPGTLDSAVFSSFVNLLYRAAPYDAHTGVVRVIYRW